MTKEQKPEALQLADFFKSMKKSSHRWHDGIPVHEKTESELRRLHARVRELEIELSEETKTADVWRDLALQFDGHRMAALGHLRMLLSCPDDHSAAATVFLSAPPLSGDKVLAERIAAMAKAQPAAHPMTDSEVLKAADAMHYKPMDTNRLDFAAGWRKAELAHGITGDTNAA